MFAQKHFGEISDLQRYYQTLAQSPFREGAEVSICIAQNKKLKHEMGTKEP